MWYNLFITSYWCQMHDFKVGEMVLHFSFGYGLILSFGKNEIGDDTAVVDFFADLSPEEVLVLDLEKVN